ncbi:MAG: phosphoglycerate dehydrogenase [Eggerthellaceae bacterium]|nr:phosphoglycerate dehydrogenase [Eggerthellaceae bacterium]
MQKKVLITEEIDPAGISVLKTRGLDIDIQLGLNENELVERIGEYDALIVRSHTQVTKKVIDAAGDRLKIIGRAGVSVDNIDLESATDRGIIVCNAPNSNIMSAAEHAMALILSCARNVPQANASMHAGEWEPGSLKGCELYEKTLAIFGLGRVGGLVAQRAASFGMNLIGYDPYCSKERAATLGVEMYEDVQDMLPLADFITVHMPKTAETAGMFGPEQFAAMKDGVIIVNVSRDGIFDEKSMADFIAAEKIRAVGFDVLEDEPCTTSPLHEFENAVLTPHIGAVTVEAQRRAGVQIATFVAQGLAGSIVPTAVNMSHVPPEVMDKFGPYLTAARMMGRIISQIEADMPRKLSLTARGTLASADVNIILASALKGILAYKNVGSVTGTNAEAVAQRHGIEATTMTHVNAFGYDSSLSLETADNSIACTLYGTDRPARIISLFGYSFDIEPAAQSIILRYVDAPGRMGVIGTILGEAGVNITTMQIGKRDDSESAVVYLNVEGDVNDEVLDELRANIDGLQNLWYVKL